MSWQNLLSAAVPHTSLLKVISLFTYTHLYIYTPLHMWCKSSVNLMKLLGGAGTPVWVVSGLYLWTYMYILMCMSSDLIWDNCKVPRVLIIACWCICLNWWGGEDSNLASSRDSPIWLVLIEEATADSLWKWQCNNYDTPGHPIPCYMYRSMHKIQKHSGELSCALPLTSRHAHQYFNCLR